MNKFKSGDKVKIEVPNSESRYGTYLGVSRNGFLLRVRPDGLKTASCYHPTFIIKADES